MSKVLEDLVNYVSEGGREGGREGERERGGRKEHRRREHHGVKATHMLYECPWKCSTVQ